MTEKKITVSIAPWLSVKGSIHSLYFYTEAFNAEVTYRMDMDNAVIAKLSVRGAEFWISESDPDQQVAVGPIRMILTVPDPDDVFARAISAGSTIVYPVEEANGWRIGRLVDPYGHHWEIGHPL